MSECDAKKAAALGAVELISRLGLDSAGRVGIGTGSTVARFVELIVREEVFGRDAIFYPSSRDSLLSLGSRGLDVGHPGAVSSLDLYVDGADEVDPQGRLVKGRGAALLGEKMLAFRSRVNIFIVDESKLVSLLGEKKPVPVEVVPDALPYVVDLLKGQGLNPIVRSGSGKDGPVVSDWGGIIVDLWTGPISDPEGLNSSLKAVPGIVETGLFLGMTDFVVVGLGDCNYRVLEFERFRRA